MTHHVAQARQLLRKVLVGPVRCALDDVDVEGTVSLESLFSGAKGFLQRWRPHRDSIIS